METQVFEEGIRFFGRRRAPAYEGEFSQETLDFARGGLLAFVKGLEKKTEKISVTLF